jgi:hypothetical protein
VLHEGDFDPPEAPSETAKAVQQEDAGKRYGSDEAGDVIGLLDPHAVADIYYAEKHQYYDSNAGSGAAWHFRRLVAENEGAAALAAGLRLGLGRVRDFVGGSAVRTDHRVHESPRREILCILGNVAEDR